MIVGDLVEKIERRRAKAREEFWDFVRRVAGGENVSAAEAERIIDNANESPRNFGDAVELMKKRLVWAALVEGQAARDAERERLAEQAAALDAKLQKAEDEHAAAIRPLQARENELRAVDGEARQAKSELERTCPDSTLLDSIKTAMRESVNALDRLNAARSAANELNKLSDAEHKTWVFREVARKYPATGSPEQAVSRNNAGFAYQQELFAERDALKRKAADLDVAERERAAAEQRVRELRAKLLIP